MYLKKKAAFQLFWTKMGSGWKRSFALFEARQRHPSRTVYLARVCSYFIGMLTKTTLTCAEVITCQR